MKTFIGLFVFRILNVLLIQTFYVPDEYWQSTEVAHNLVFGYGYLTWEWEKRIRGYLHPLLFAITFKFLQLLDLDTRTTLVWSAKVLQVIFASIGDVFFLKLARRVVGGGVAKWALLAHLTNHFALFTLTRTLSNSLETILSVAALSYFDWGNGNEKYCDRDRWVHLSLAALSIVVRPTALITWMPLWAWTLLKENSRFKFSTQLASAGTVTIIASILLDSHFYGQFTFVPWEFLKFNVIHGISTLYGSHPFHWYLTQGFPVVLGPHILPYYASFAYVRKSRNLALASLTAWMILVYSLLSHKEFRFILTALPLAMCQVGTYFDAVAHRQRWRRNLVIGGTTCLNILLFLYLSLFHQRGSLDAVNDIASEMETNPSQPYSILFLLPCHQHPYHAHVHRNVTLKFLTCEPNFDGVEDYMDEADLFFSGPEKWLNDFMQETDERPSHVIVSQTTALDLDISFKNYEYDLGQSYFHCHVPMDSRMGREILVYRKRIVH